MSNENNFIYNVPSGCFSSLIGVFLAFLVCLLLSLLFAGCKKGYITERVEVPVVVTQEHTIESVKIDHVRDTLIQRDSVYHYIQGDTVHIERWHYVQGTTNVVRVDTVHKTDSVQVPVVTTQTIEKRVEVPRPLSWWQKVLIAIGGIALIVAGLLTAYRLGKRIV